MLVHDARLTVRAILENEGGDWLLPVWVDDIGVHSILCKFAGS